MAKLMLVSGRVFSPKYVLTQPMANLKKLLGMTYLVILVGKTKFNLLFLGPLVIFWLSKCVSFDVGVLVSLNLSWKLL